MSRTLTKVVTSVWQDEGVGARVRRSVGRPEVSNFIETTSLQLEMIQLSNIYTVIKWFLLPHTFHFSFFLIP